METTTTTQSHDSLEFVESVFKNCCGNAQVRLGGELVGFDRKRKEVFIKDYGRKTIWMPAAEVLNYLTTEECGRLKDLPAWDAGNGWKISGEVLFAMFPAIQRYNGRHHWTRYKGGGGECRILGSREYEHSTARRVQTPAGRFCAECHL